MPRFDGLDLVSSIAGRTALGAGGARGIGAASVEALLGHGARVAFTYSRDAEKAATLCRRWPRQSSAHFLDLRDRGSIDRCFAEVEARWGALHIVVQNAA